MRLCGKRQFNGALDDVERHSVDNPIQIAWQLISVRGFGRINLILDTFGVTIFIPASVNRSFVFLYEGLRESDL